MRGFCSIFVLCLLPAAFGQIGYPGQYPGQAPGRYPGGQGPGLPIPHRGSKKGNTDTEHQTLTTTGMLRSMEDKFLVLEADDTRLIKFVRNDKTKYLKEDATGIKPSDLKPGDHLQVEASQNDEGNQFAVNVTLQKAGSPSERSAASQPVDMGESDTGSGAPRGDDDRPVLRRKDAPAKPAVPATPAKAETPPPAPEDTIADNSPSTVVTPPPIKQSDPEDPGPPQLKRGKATARRSAAPAEEPATQPVLSAKADVRQPAPAAPAPSASKPDILMVRAREAAFSFGESLPNYIAQQFTARDISTTHTPSWQPQDVISAEVIYENGRERYRNLAVGGKATKKSFEELGGAWSTGEFGSVLLDVFSPATNADFRKRSDTNIAGRTALVYDFTVEQPNSHWTVRVPSQSVHPAYAGTVWLDKSTAKVLRIEMQARHIPRAFPLDTVETAVDYQFVRIGEHEYLLPVHAELLSCIRGTDDCSKNTIDFRNYHKFTGESNIVFEK